DRGHEDELAVRPSLERADELRRHLRLVMAERQKMFARYAQLLADSLDRLLPGFPGNLEISLGHRRRSSQLRSPRVKAHSGGRRESTFVCPVRFYDQGTIAGTRKAGVAGPIGGRQPGGNQPVGRADPAARATVGKRRPRVKTQPTR